LDFDFEKFCSVSLSNLNVYACLVCGKYYQGRGKKSHAYTHSLEAGHHVYVNLRTEKVYCLPDGYEIIDPSLDDIRHVLNPRSFSPSLRGALYFSCGHGVPVSILSYSS
jgi:U4/U6.U5 tri-snRNP-associated protein 2